MNLLTNFYFFVLLMQVTFGHQWVSSNKTDTDGGCYWVIMNVFILNALVSNLAVVGLFERDP